MHIKAHWEKKADATRLPVQRFKNAENVKEMSEVIESEKKLRKEYDELAARCEVMEQKLEKAHSEKEIDYKC